MVSIRSRPKRCSYISPGRPHCPVKLGCIEAITFNSLMRLIWSCVSISSCSILCRRRVSRAFGRIVSRQLITCSRAWVPIAWTASWIPLSWDFFISVSSSSRSHMAIPLFSGLSRYPSVTQAVLAPIDPSVNSFSPPIRSLLSPNPLDRPIAMNSSRTFGVK